ncbi:asparagine--tRNA ligase [Gossypium hirsutum]|nr:asparagine--tRNA ligase-like [Gossypium hirsutum]
MVVPKMGTVITGSQSEERLDMLSARMKEFDLSRDQYEWYQDLRKHGTVKHSGFRLGFDLMVLLMTGLTDVRDVVPFPRTHGKANN